MSEEEPKWFSRYIKTHDQDHQQLERKIEELEKNLESYINNDVSFIKNKLDTTIPKQDKRIVELEQWKNSLYNGSKNKEYKMCLFEKWQTSQMNKDYLIFKEVMCKQMNERREQVEELEQKLEKKQDLFPLHKGAQKKPLMNIISELEEKLDSHIDHFQLALRKIIYEHINTQGDEYGEDIQELLRMMDGFREGFVTKQKNQNLICKCGKKIEITVPMYADKDDNFVCKECFDKLALAEKLLQLDDETFKSAKEIFINSKIKFLKGPIFDLTLNINIIKELNIAQLKFIFSLINTELEEREKNEKS